MAVKPTQNPTALFYRQALRNKTQLDKCRKAFDGLTGELKDATAKLEQIKALANLVDSPSKAEQWAELRRILDEPNP